MRLERNATDFDESDTISVSLGDVRTAVFREIMDHCDSLGVYGPNLSEFEAQLIAGSVVRRLAGRLA